jgi:hypothetical protein
MQQVGTITQETHGSKSKKRMVIIKVNSSRELFLSKLLKRHYATTISKSSYGLTNNNNNNNNNYNNNNSNNQQTTKLLAH